MVLNMILDEAGGQGLTPGSKAIRCALISACVLVVNNKDLSGHNELTPTSVAFMIYS